MGVVNAVKAGAKVLKAAYHDAGEDTIKGYLTEAKDALTEAIEGMDETPADAPKTEVKVAVAVTTDIPRDEINEEKIKAIATSIDEGLTTVDDWVLAPTERVVLTEAMLEFGKDLFGQEVDPATPVDDDEEDDEAEDEEYARAEETIVDETPAEEYDRHDKKCLMKVIGFGKTLRKAARSVNRHIDKGDYTPNREKLRKVNKELIGELKGLVAYFEKEDKPKAAEFAKHLVGCAYELRKMRFAEKVTARANIVKRFATKVVFED